MTNLNPDRVKLRMKYIFDCCTEEEQASLEALVQVDLEKFKELVKLLSRKYS